MLLVGLVGCHTPALPAPAELITRPSVARVADSGPSPSPENDGGASDASPTGAYERAAMFGTMEWGFEGEDVVARGPGRATRLRPPDGGQFASGGQSGSPSCAFLDATHAWCVVIAGEWPQRAVDVFRTTDGGASWTSSHLAGPGFTDWPLGPWATLTFRDAQHGNATVVDPPQHHNGHRETTWSYATRDGGKTWSLVQTKSRCLDPAEHCLHG